MCSGDRWVAILAGNILVECGFVSEWLKVLLLFELRRMPVLVVRHFDGLDGFGYVSRWKVVFG